MQQQQEQNLLTTWRPIHRTRIVEHKRGLQAENLHPNRPDKVLRVPTSLESSRNPDSRELPKDNQKTRPSRPVSSRLHFIRHIKQRKVTRFKEFFLFSTSTIGKTVY